MGSDSSILYATPSFTEGMARIMDFADTLTEYNRSPSAEQADENALAADWRAVAKDLTAAIKQVTQTFPDLDAER